MEPVIDGRYKPCHVHADGFEWYDCAPPLCVNGKSIRKED